MSTKWHKKIDWKIVILWGGNLKYVTCFHMQLENAVGMIVIYYV